jgi:hypothetical protein
MAASAFDMTLYAVDPFGNIATGFTGTASFSSSDPTAVLPSKFTFMGADQGNASFAAGGTLSTLGLQYITVQDESGLISDTVSIMVVSPSAPPESRPAVWFFAWLTEKPQPL